MSHRVHAKPGASRLHPRRALASDLAAKYTFIGMPDVYSASAVSGRMYRRPLLSGHGQGLAILTGPEFQQEWNGGLRPFDGTEETRGLAAECAPEHVGIDDAGVERNRGQAPGKFLAECACEAFDAPFGRAIRGDLG